ncbi:MAG: hypothetical protein Q8S73_29160 [Deltaproteobacteria bacterium]|nr:hypothetical protein [Myxococcales bacterium]MDP3218211.1 hypothetical protein [Deltaproteobacteria bacterium]
MNRPLVSLARQILYVAVFASGLRRGTGATRASYRRTVYAWSSDTVARLLRGYHPDPEDDLTTAQPMLRAIEATVERMQTDQGGASPSDWYPQHPEALMRDARSLLWAALGTDRSQRFLWGIECVAVMCRRMTLTLVAALVGVGLVFGSPTVRGVVFQSSAGLLSLVVLMVMLFMGAWLTFPLGLANFWSPLSLRPERKRDAWPATLSHWRIVGAWGLIGLAFVLVVGGFLLIAPREASFRTPFVTTTMLVGVLTLWHGFDIWDYLDPRPVRFVAAVAASFALWAILGYSPDAPWMASTDTAPTRPAPTVAVASPWVGADRWPPPGDGPVVVVAASGGGSRAAMFAASALLAMHDETPAVESSVQAVSGVSGGSLAMAGYVALRLGRVTPERYREAMEADYVWPLLQAIVTLHDRADAVQSDWNERLHLGGVTLSSLARAWNAGDTRAPVPVLNSADVLGHPVLLSAFAPALLDAADRSRCRESTGVDDPWICDRDVGHTLQEIAPGTDVPLLSAARASANFPLAFPLVPVRAAQPLTGHEHLGDPRTTRITDGGVFLNSGVQGLYPLLLQVRAELRRRGVLMIVLDASAADAFTRYPGEWETVTALRGAGVGRAQMLHRLMLTRLASEYGARFGCVLVDMLPADLARIPTSWYLDEAARASMRRHFTSARWAAQRGHITEAFAAVRAGGTGAADVASCLARPPLF